MGRASRHIRSGKDNGRPPVLTQHGHSAAVVLDIELLHDVQTAIEQIETDQGVSNRAAKAELARRFSPRR